MVNYHLHLTRPSNPACVFSLTLSLRTSSQLTFWPGILYSSVCGFCRNISIADIPSEEVHEEGEEHQAQTSPHRHLLQPHHSSLAAASSPCGMEISPLPSQPALVHLQQRDQPPILSPTLGHHQRTSTADSNSSSSSNSSSAKPSPSLLTTSAAANTHKSFDQSFFSKLSNHGQSASTNRSRTRSADVPLSSKDVNASSSTSSFTLDKPPFSSHGLKKPHGLLRTSSARPSLLSTQHSSLTNISNENSNNPFQVSPRPNAFLERAHSDNSLSFGGTFPQSTRETRKPSNLGRGDALVSMPASRPSLVSFGSSQGRKISGR